MAGRGPGGRGHRLLRSEPSAGEADLSFAGLSDLLADALPQTAEQIPASQRAALYGGVSVCLLASAVLPSGKLTAQARAVRLATSAAAMGLVFMGAIVVPVYLVPALTLTVAIGLAAESHPDLSARVFSRARLIQHRRTAH